MTRAPCARAQTRIVAVRLTNAFLRQYVIQLEKDLWLARQVGPGVALFPGRPLAGMPACSRTRAVRPVRQTHRIMGNSFILSSILRS